MPPSLIVTFEEYIRKDTTFLSKNIDEAGDTTVECIADDIEVSNTLQSEMIAGVPSVLQTETETVTSGEDEYAPVEEVGQLEEALVTISGDYETSLNRSGDLVGAPSEARQEGTKTELPNFSQMRYVPPHKRDPSSGVKYTDQNPHTYVPPAGKIQSRIPIASFPHKPKELTAWWQAEYEKFRIFMERRHEKTPVGKNEGSDTGNELEWRQREANKSEERGQQTAIGQGQGSEAIYSTGAPSRVLLLHKDSDSNSCTSSGGGADAGRSCVEGGTQAQASEHERPGIRDFLPAQANVTLTDESADF